MPRIVNPQDLSRESIRRYFYRIYHFFWLRGEPTPAGLKQYMDDPFYWLRKYKDFVAQEREQRKKSKKITVDGVRYTIPPETEEPTIEWTNAYALGQQSGEKFARAVTGVLNGNIEYSRTVTL